MNVVNSNKDRTVGVCTDIDNLYSIGEFDLAYIEEWIKNLKLLYGNDHKIQLFVRKADFEDAFVLIASSDGENPFVVVAGHHPLDGKPWKGQLDTKQKPGGV